MLEPTEALSTGISVVEARVTSLDFVPVTSHVPTTHLDPFEVVVKVPPEAAYVAFFNGRDVDASGAPQCIGVAVREGHDPSQFNATASAGIMSREFPRNARVVRFSDDTSSRVALGDPILAVALDKRAQFLSADTLKRPLNMKRTEVYPARLQDGKHVPDTSLPPFMQSPQVGDGLDRTGVNRFDQKLALEVRASRRYSPPNWLDESVADGSLRATLVAKRGFIFEPGARAELSFKGKSMGLVVKGVDAEVSSFPVRLPGSPPCQGSCRVGPLQQGAEVMNGLLREVPRSNAQEAPVPWWTGHPGAGARDGRVVGHALSLAS